MEMDDKELLSLFNEIRRYGEIVKDEIEENPTGSWRRTTWMYDDIKFFTVQHNGELISIF